MLIFLWILQHLILHFPIFSNPYYTKDILVVLYNPLNAESFEEILSCCTISLTASKFPFFCSKKSVKMKLRNNQFRYQFQNAKSTLGKDQTNCGSK